MLHVEKSILLLELTLSESGGLPILTRRAEQVEELEGKLVENPLSGHPALATSRSAQRRELSEGGEALQTVPESTVLRP